MTTALRRAALPAALGVAALATLTGGVAASGDLRADQRRTEAVAAEQRRQQQLQRERDEYATALEPVAQALYDVVQPLQQAYADLATGATSALDVLVDVGVHVGSDRGLPVTRSQLAALRPAASVQERHDALLAAVDALLAAARRVDALEASDDEDRYTALVAEGDVALDAATRTWTRELVPVFGAGSSPPVPREAGVDGTRRPLSQASWLREAGNLCSSGLDRDLDLGEDPSVQQVRASLGRLAERIPQLVAVPAPAQDEQLLTDSVRQPLQGTLEISAGFDAALSAAERGDEPGLRQGQAQIARAEVAAEKAGIGLREYGSQLCALYLVGFQEGGQEPAEDGTRDA